MNVSQLMNQNVAACRPSSTLDEAARLMWDRDVGALPVVDDAGVVVGMITDRDICMAAFTQGQPLYGIAVATAMSREVFSCGADDTLIAAEEIMRTHQVRRLPIVDQGGHLVGVLSLNDLAMEAAHRRNGRGRQVSGEEIAVTLAAVGAHRQTVALATRAEVAPLAM